MSVENLSAILNNLKLDGKNVKEEKDFTDRIINNVKAERKVVPRVLPTLIEMVRQYSMFLAVLWLVESLPEMSVRPPKLVPMPPWMELSLL